MKLVGIVILAMAIVLISGVASASTEQVLIKDFAFHPAQITIQQGDTVTWTHPGPASHTVKFSDSESPILKNGGQYSKTFNDAGTFEYECGVHPYMKGTVIVK
jgi:plastocyanin